MRYKFPKYYNCYSDAARTVILPNCAKKMIKKYFFRPSKRSNTFVTRRAPMRPPSTSTTSIWSEEACCARCVVPSISCRYGHGILAQNQFRCWAISNDAPFRAFTSLTTYSVYHDSVSNENVYSEVWRKSFRMIILTTFFNVQSIHFADNFSTWYPWYTEDVKQRVGEIDNQNIDFQNGIFGESLLQYTIVYLVKCSWLCQPSLVRNELSSYVSL